MLIVVSAVASAVALLGALLVGYSTHNTIAHMVPTRDPNSVLTAFPADVEDQIKRQEMTASGVAAPQPAEDQPTPDSLANTLRDTIAQATGESVKAAQTETDAKNQTQSDTAAAPDIKELASKLEGLLLDKGGNSDTTDLSAMREYALRELTAQDGSVVLPNYKVQDLGVDNAGLGQEIMDQIAELQTDLNQQIAQLSELKGRQLSTKDVQLNADASQIGAALDALKLQSDMLGVDISSDQRYGDLRSLGEQLLGNGKVNLDGLDMNELEQVSRDLLYQLCGSLDDKPAGQATSESPAPLQ